MEGRRIIKDGVKFSLDLGCGVQRKKCWKLMKQKDLDLSKGRSPSNGKEWLVLFLQLRRLGMVKLVLEEMRCVKSLL